MPFKSYGDTESLRYYVSVNLIILASIVCRPALQSRGQELAVAVFELDLGCWKTVAEDALQGGEIGSLTLELRLEVRPLRLTPNRGDLHAYLFGCAVQGSADAVQVVAGKLRHRQSDLSRVRFDHGCHQQPDYSPISKTSMTTSTPGPCTPVDRVSSMSAVRLGPVACTHDDGVSAPRRASASAMEGTSCSRVSTIT